MNTNTKELNLKELSLDEMENVNGGWLITICGICLWAAAMMAIPYLVPDRND